MLIKSLKQRIYEKKLRSAHVPMELKTAYDQVKKLDTNRSIQDAGFVVIDTETTGFHPEQGDSLLSLAAIRMVRGRVDLSESFYELIKPDREIPRESVKIHHLTPGILSSHPVGVLPDVLIRFFEFCGGNVLVGHHVALDLRFLNHALKQHFGAGMANPTVDTALLASAIKEMEDPVKASMQGADHVGLDDLAKEFKISMPHRHDAYGDAFATAMIFQRQIGILRKNHVKTLKELLRLAGVD
ncbi:MAG: 3'-5' exonuclease [Deltaproteobacteria bacterium]|nr:3'-5' exonuclease [Deltaproteobacteria bacterium]